MMGPKEDQAAGLRRLFRRAPPTVAALFVAGRDRPRIAAETAHRLAGSAGRVLLLDEAAGAEGLAEALGLAEEGCDLLGVLSGRVTAAQLVQSAAGRIGRVPVSAASVALPLLDDERRRSLVAALASLHRRAGFVLIHAMCASADDPSPLVHAAPRRLVVAEASRTGAADAYRTIRHLAAGGAGSLHIAVARARTRPEARAFFRALEALVREYVGVPLAWLGELERDDLAAGLADESMPLSSREAGAAFLRRLAALGRNSAGARFAVGMQP